MIKDVRLYKRGKYYYVEFERGKARSLGTGSQVEAKQLYHQIRREYMAGRLADISGRSCHTIGDFHRALEDMGPVDKSLGSFKNDLAALRKLINQTGRTLSLDRLGLKHLHEMTAALQRRGLKPNTINLHIRHARAALNRAVEWEWIAENPLKNATQVPVPKKFPRFLDIDQAIKFLAGIENREKRRFVAAAISTGRRIGELLALNWEDVDIDRGGTSQKTSGPI